MVIRYAFLVTLAASAVWAVINLGASNAQMYMVDAGQGGSQATASFWMLAGLATLITASLCRFVIFGLPLMVDDWYRDHKSWLYAILLGGLAYAFLYLM